MHGLMSMPASCIGHHFYASSPCGQLRVCAVCSSAHFSSTAHPATPPSAPALTPSQRLPCRRLCQATGSVDEVTADDVAGGEVDEVVQNLALRITEVRRHLRCPEGRKRVHLGACLWRARPGLKARRLHASTRVPRPPALQMRQHSRRLVLQRAPDEGRSPNSLPCPKLALLCTSHRRALDVTRSLASTPSRTAAWRAPSGNTTVPSGTPLYARRLRRCTCLPLCAWCNATLPGASPLRVTCSPFGLDAPVSSLTILPTRAILH